MENQEHQEFDENAAFNEAVETLETGELTADKLPSDAEETKQDTSDQREDHSESSDTEDKDVENDLPEWLADATDEVKENFRKLEAEKKRFEHQARSQNGRVGALTKKYQKLQAELEKAKQSTQDTPQLRGDLEKIRVDFPEIAAVLDNVLAVQNQRINDIYQPINSIAEANMLEMAQHELDNSISHVTQVIPDAENIVTDPQFSNWLEKQPVGIKALFNSNDVNDAIYLLSEYKKTVSANAVRRNKQSQQLSAMSLPSGRNAPKGGEEIDEDALFNQIAAQFDKQRSR